jgi:hypothetical protein
MPVASRNELKVTTTPDLSTASLPDDLLSPTTSDGESPRFLDEFEPNIPSDLLQQPLAVDTNLSQKSPLRATRLPIQPNTPGSSSAPRSPRVFVTVTKPNIVSSDTPAAVEPSLARGKSARVIITTGSKRTVLNVDTTDPANLVKVVEVTRIPSVASMTGSLSDAESVFSETESLPVLSPAGSVRSTRDEAVHVTRRTHSGIPSTTVSTPLGGQHRQTSPLKPRHQPPPVPTHTSSCRSRSPLPTRSTSPPLHHHPRSDEPSVKPGTHSHSSLSRALHLQETEVIRVQTLLDAAVQQRVRAYMALQEAKGGASTAGVGGKQRQAAVSAALAQLTAREKQEDRLRARLQRETMLKEALVVDAAAAEVHERVKTARAVAAGDIKAIPRPRRPSSPRMITPAAKHASVNVDTRCMESKPVEDKRGWSPAGSLFSPSEVPAITAVPMSPAAFGCDP